MRYEKPLIQRRTLVGKMIPQISCPPGYFPKGDVCIGVVVGGD